MRTITPRELESALSSRPGLALIDVRTAVEFAEIHVPKAHNVPLDALNPEGLLTSGRISLTEPVYLLCRSGGRAAKAAEKFEQAGFQEAVVVDGGTLAWDAAGLPVDRGTVKTISLERQVRIAAGSLVLLGFLLSLVLHPAFIFLSVFVGAGLVFAGITDWCGMGLLLAKAPWNRR